VGARTGEINQRAGESYHVVRAEMACAEAEQIYQTDQRDDRAVEEDRDDLGEASIQEEQNEPDRTCRRTGGSTQDHTCTWRED